LVWGSNPTQPGIEVVTTKIKKGKVVREISPLDSCSNPIGGATQLSITEKKFLVAFPGIGLRTKNVGMLLSVKD
jgi:hypothetical protein